MANTNCLEGMKCPNCGQEDNFRITAEAVFDVTDDGTDLFGSVEWDDDSPVVCLQCMEITKVARLRGVSSVDELCEKLDQACEGLTGKDLYSSKEIAAAFRLLATRWEEEE
jgi:hypothetical protein